MSKSHRFTPATFYPELCLYCDKTEAAGPHDDTPPEEPFDPDGYSVDKSPL